MPYLTGNWWALLPAPWAPVGLVLTTIVAGAIVGSERERREKPAGLRTLVLVCLGSTVFTMVSFAFSTTSGDSGRVAAQIVTGIGFLGGGVILRDAVGVTGATTAATIWITAAMGMTIGAGFAPGGLAVALVMRTSLFALHALETRRIRHLPATVVAIKFDPDHGKTRLRIERILTEFDATYEILGAVERDDLAEARLRFRLPHRHARELLGHLADLAQMHEIRELPSV